ncbi:MAG: replication initiation protein [Mollicutes bacterium PWAP]|nr:replication initiation protein [Mollicutes bacterium PWAP]
MKNQNETISKSKTTALMTPSKLLNSLEQFAMMTILKKIGTKNWDYQKNEIIKDNNNDIKINITWSEISKFSEKSKEISTLDSTKKRRLLENISSFSYRLEFKDSTKFIPVFKELEWKNGTGEIHAIFNDKFTNHLIEVKKDLVIFDLPSVKKFKSKYTFRLYEFLKAKHNGQYLNYKMSIQEFREITHNLNKNPRFASLRTSALEPAIKELQNSDFPVKYEFIKNGRNYSHIHFTLNGEILEVRVKENQRAVIPFNKQTTTEEINILLEKFEDANNIEDKNNE